jgi:DNA-binding response OmpR family regulator
MSELTLEAQSCGSHGSVILLANGDGEVARGLSNALQAAGHRVLSAANGREAQSLLSHMQEGIDLLVTDADLPGLSGLDLAADSTRTCASRPVLLISGRPVPPEAELSAWDYLPKPVDPREFIEVVESILARPSTQTARKIRQASG